MKPLMKILDGIFNPMNSYYEDTINKQEKLLAEAYAKNDLNIMPVDKFVKEVTKNLSKTHANTR